MSSSAVGIVHDWLTGQRGGENVLAAICRLFPGAPLYTLFHFPGSVDPAIERHPIVTSFLQQAPGLDPAYRWYLPLFPAAVEDLPVGDHRLLVSSSHCVAKAARRAPGGWHLCYCHTPMRYAWDQEKAYFGERRGAIAWVQRAILALLRRWDVATADRVDRYVANSSFVRERIRRHYSRVAEVVPPPVATDFYSLASGPLPREHVLVVAALAPYKKVERAIQACAAAELPLVVVGDGPERRRLEREADTNVRFVGRASAEELRELYQRAVCYLQPGVEDFGIASVEALACGTPVVALGQGGVCDIIRNGRDGLLLDSSEPGELRAAIDKCRQMQFNPLNLRERAEQFAPEHFTRRLRQLLVSDRPDLEGYIA